MKLRMHAVVLAVLQLAVSCWCQSGGDPITTTDVMDYNMEDLFTTTVEELAPETTESPTPCDPESGSGAGNGSFFDPSSGCKPTEEVTTPTDDSPTTDEPCGPESGSGGGGLGTECPPSSPTTNETTTSTTTAETTTSTTTTQEPTTTPTPCPEILLENCTIPDVLPPRPTIDLVTAKNKAFCYASCSERVLPGQLPILEELNYPGYPLWSAVTRSFILEHNGTSSHDCLEGRRDNYNGCNINCNNLENAYREILDCERGCLLVLSQPDVTNCARKCRDDCRNNRETGCGGNVHSGRCFPTLTGAPYPCGFDCNQNRGCKEGCELNTFPGSYPQAAVPTEPPVVTAVTGSAELYYIDFNSTQLPMADVRLRYSTIVVRIVDLSAPCDPPEYIVLDEGFQFNLGGYSCREVNISYAVSSFGKQLSPFSSSTTVEVRDAGGNGAVPCQLETFDFTVSADPDNFRYHVIELSWDPPCRSEAIENYLISETSLPVCGRIPDVSLSKNATNYTIRGPDQFNPDDVIGPITRCTYSITITVLPRGPDEGNPPNIQISSGTYPEPSNDDMKLECSSMANQRTGSYDLTVRIVLSALFTPVVLAQYISHFQLIRTAYDLSTDPDTVIPGAPIPMHNILKKNGSFELETTFIGVPSLGFNQEYRFSATAGFEANVPRGSYLGGSSINTAISTLCHLPDVGPVPPGNMLNVSSTVIGRPTESSAPGQRNVFADVNVTWSRPELEGAEITGYQFTVRLEPLELNDTSTIDIHTVSENVLSIQQSFSFNVLLDTFTIFAQVRARTRNELPGLWSEPVEVNVTVFNPPPPGTMIPKQHFNVTESSYIVEPDKDELRVTVNIDLIPPSIELGVVKQYEFYGGPIELGPMDDETTTSRFSPSGGNSPVQTSTQRYSIDFPEPGTVTATFVQMRAITKFQDSLLTRVGNWSIPETVLVIIVSPPQNISIIGDTDFFAVTVGEMIQLTVRIDLEWSAVNTSVDDASTSRRKRQAESNSVTGHEVALGTEPIETYGIAAQDTLVRRFGGDTLSETLTGMLTFDRDEDLMNTTLYLQIKTLTSASGDTGAWSSPKAVRIDSIRYPTVGLTVAVMAGIGVGVPLVVILAVVLIILIIPVILLFYRKRKYQYIPAQDGENLMNPQFDQKLTYFLPGEIEGKEPLLDEWEVDTGEVIVEDHLGEGAFGMVFKGTIRGPLRNSKLSPKLKQSIAIPVAIKLLKDTASRKERKDFLDEIETMKKISDGFNPHIVNMVGCVTLQEPLCLITEFVPHGDLLDYLRNQRKKAASKRRADKMLRQQLEEQKKAYDELRRKVEMLQSAQDDPSRSTGGSGYAEFVQLREIEAPGKLEREAENESTMEPEKVDFQKQIRDQVLQEEEAGLQTIVEENTFTSDNDELPTSPAPYLEANGEYSHLDNQKETESDNEEEEEDPYSELGQLEANDLMQFAYQIAGGMEYLASLNIVHRDLACRNILVDEGKSLKITDFGLSREVEEVYVKRTRGRLPLKWMALESINAREFSTASDVWSFGVVLWEIGTLGGFPYPAISNTDLLMMLKQGYRLEKPDNCAPEVYQVMLECWNEHPEDRPTFTELRDKFSRMLLATTTDTYMVLEVDDQKTYYTMDDEEESRERSGSTSSSDSDSSIKKKKKEPIKKPVWKATNPYVDTPATRVDLDITMEEETQREGVTTVTLEGNEAHSSDEDEQERGGESAYVDQPPVRPAPDMSTTYSNAHGNFFDLEPKPHSMPTNTHNFGGDQRVETGIPISMLSEEKPNQHRPISHAMKSNPYVEAPGTEQLLPDPPIEEESLVTRLQPLSEEMGLRIMDGGDTGTAL